MIMIILVVIGIIGVLSVSLVWDRWRKTGTGAIDSVEGKVWYIKYQRPGETRYMMFRSEDTYNGFLEKYGDKVPMLPDSTGRSGFTVISGEGDDKFYAFTEL